ncbi:MAG TPA: tetratricopeptide repeat protein, partial [Gemmataceae bacterium]|nr:tetratricopeptide repeat protein [Gemmataceae bacterium]
QALANRIAIDLRTDIYSLGVTLYELLTLQVPFGGENRQELLRQIAFEEPAPPRRINRTIPQELDIIALKAMEKSPVDRYATAKELAEDLRRYLADEPIQAKPASITRRLRKWSRRHPATTAAALAALTAAVMVLSGGIGWVVNDNAMRAKATESEVNRALDESVEWQQKRRVPEALATARRAQAALSGGHADAELGRRTEARVHDLDLLARLEKARLEGAAVKGKHFDTAQGDSRYSAIFQEYHLDIDGWSALETGKHIGESTVALELASLLDEWAMLRLRLDPKDASRAKHLLEVARVADPDGWRTQLRDALASKDREALLKLASSDKAEQLLPWTCNAVVKFLQTTKDFQQAETLLRRGRQQHPEDFWINEELGILLLQATPSRRDEAIPFLMIAVALRPQSPGARVNLGFALAAKNELDGAIAEYRHAIEIDPGYASAHTNLAIALASKNNLEEAVAEFRKAVELDPTESDAHFNLGTALLDKNDLDGAIAEFSEAIRIDPKSGAAHGQLGVALAQKNDLNGAIREYLEVIKIDHRSVQAFNNLGNTYAAKNAIDKAIGAFRKATEIDPNYALAHNNLAEILQDQGQFAEALKYFRLGQDIATKNPRRPPYPSAQKIKDCQRLLELDAKLSAIISGKEQPADAGQRAGYAEVCRKKHLYLSATRLYRESITAKPDLVDSPDNGLRYDAACTAAQAGCGQGEDAVNLAAEEYAFLRQQALTWLGADLAAWRQILEKDRDKARAKVVQTMTQWLQDTDFKGVRSKEGLAKLPEDERQGWEKLWQEVAALKERAGSHP